MSRMSLRSLFLCADDKRFVLKLWPQHDFGSGFVLLLFFGFIWLFGAKTNSDKLVLNIGHVFMLSTGICTMVWENKGAISAQPNTGPKLRLNVLKAPGVDSGRRHLSPLNMSVKYACQ